MTKPYLRSVVPAIILLLTIIFLTCCYNDNEEYLYPEQPGGCDTTNVTFSGSIKPITDAYCLSCHSGTTANAGVKVETYVQIKALADDGRLVNVINGANGYPLMPQGASLSDCKIKTIEIWVALGASNN